MRNLRRPEKYEALFKKFTEAAHPVSGKPVFSTIRDFLCFLAVLGFDRGDRTAIEGKTIDLDSRVFETHEQSRDILYLVALAGTRDANILQPEREDEIARVFEEYVATGLSVLDGWMKQCADDHIGDQSILTALRRDGFFESHAPTIGEVIDQLEF
jgi:dnd system-associated protein 4